MDFHQETLQVDKCVAIRYPRDIPLLDGSEVVITPMVPSDWNLLEEFLRVTPESERKFFRRDVSDPLRVERWCRELDYQHYLPLLAWDGETIVADATLQQDPGLWTAHIGKVRLSVHPDFRGRGIGALMVRELIEVACDLGLHKIVHECAAEQKGLIALLERIGFVRMACLKDFIRDRDGDLHEMVLMVRGLVIDGEFDDLRDY